MTNFEKDIAFDDNEYVFKKPEIDELKSEEFISWIDEMDRKYNYKDISLLKTQIQKLFVLNKSAIYTHVNPYNQIIYRTLYCWPWKLQISELDHYMVSCTITWYHRTSTLICRFPQRIDKIEWFEKQLNHIEKLLVKNR